MPGRVKTRLAKSIGDIKALEIYNKLLVHTIQVIKSSNFDYKFYFTAKYNNSLIIDYKLQIGLDLGDKMYNALIDELDYFDRVCIIGSDCLTLTSNDIANAFKQLNSHDVVLGPATDGGYYLIGMKKPHRQLFSNITWGASTVLAESLQECSKANLTVKLLREQNDVDTIEDVPREWL